MPYLLNIFYLLLILAALPWLAWQAVRKGKYREGYAAKFLGLAPRRPGARTCLWLHAVSVGEVHLLAPLLSRIQRDRPDWECVLSTTTKTGMASAKKKYAGLTVFYCPLDFSWAVRTAMRRIRPNLLVLAELELWPNLVRAAREHGARVAVVNGRLSEHSFAGYRRIRPLVARLLRQIDLLAVQDETYAERFRALGARSETVCVTGSMKYDGAQTDRGNPATQRLARLAGFAPDDVVFLAGSTQEPEEQIALDVFRQLSSDWPKLRLVLVPRHPERFEAVARLLDASGVAWQRRTALDANSVGGGQHAAADGGSRPSTHPTSSTHPMNSSLLSPVSCLPPSPSPRILLVDVVGELGAWWGTAQIAFVGGSLGRRGGQNMIEPAAYGAAVCFGPNTWNFRDIVATMLARQAAVVVADGSQLFQFVRRCLAQPADAAELGRQAQALVLDQLGATEATFALLDRLIPTPPLAGNPAP
jgi:3-deoxy-D-manno-octulosonic-acid transferase